MRSHPHSWLLFLLPGSPSGSCSDATLHSLLSEAPRSTERSPDRVPSPLRIQLDASCTHTCALQWELHYPGLDRLLLSPNPQGETKRKPASLRFCKACDGSLLKLMKKTPSLGVTQLMFISSLATCKTTVSEALIRQCDRSACDHKHHC